MTEKRKPTIGRTPQDEIVAETPRTARPPVTATWGGMLALLGEPTSRYGRLLQGDKVSTRVKLKMLSDPVIAMTSAYVSSKLVKAEYEIRCADAGIRVFFEAMYGAFHRELMLQASMGVLLGACGLIKRLRFEIPHPIEEGDLPVWTSRVQPYICIGFDQTAPVGAVPKFSREGKYEGFSHSGGDVDRVYSLWLTFGRHMAFGRYSGWGRLNNAYKSWWLGEFGYDQLAVHMQKYVDRAVIVDFPPGRTQEGKEHGDVAIARGDDVRSGATIALPSSVYAVLDDLAGTEKLTAIRKWAVRLLESAENIQAFLSLRDHVDARKAMAMLLPLQTYQAVEQSSLGGPTTADVLGKLATDLLIGEANELDIHINDYLFAPILHWNFGPDAPRVVKRTTGLNEQDRGELFELLRILTGRVDADAGDRIDVATLGHRLDVPMHEGLPVVQRVGVPELPGQPGDQDEGGDIETTAVSFARGDISLATFMEQMGTEFDPKKARPTEVLEHILSERIGPESDDDRAAVITEDDVERVMRALSSYPELADLQAVEVAEESEA